MGLKLFVYGTLRKGNSAHKLLAKWQPDFLGEVITDPAYRLYDQGGFPGMVKYGGIDGGVHGELYELDDNIVKLALEDLDAYECVEMHLFRREIILLEDGSKATAYLYVRGWTEGMEVKDGKWYKD